VSAENAAVSAAASSFVAGDMMHKQSCAALGDRQRSGRSSVILVALLGVHIA
jgi:hypothetical protein